ncbi:MAG: pyrroline-5-carboxylate reductase [Hyphomicrobiales bacterium]|nr:MAG: pyrroline-5-carboxylate reductase [Hyphomicrobiales bacterium]
MSASHTNDLAKALPLVLVGAGKMGGAMLAGWLGNGLDPAGVTILDPNPAPEMQALAAKKGIGQAAAAPEGLTARVLVIAVKPQSMDAVLPALRSLVGGETLVVSVAAGTTIATLADGLGGGTIVRVMPNTPAQVGRGMSVAVSAGDISAEDRAIVDALMTAVGAVAWIDDEADIDAVTGVSGSGPAYVFYMVECMAAAARAAGLNDELAMQLTRQTVSGAGELLHQSDLDAATLRKNVTSPGGTTAEGLAVLMADGGLEELMTKAVAAATRRSRELAG